MPSISVIIPCYNLSSYLNPCFESILKQNNSSVEYIFVNDGSTDDTLHLLENFAKGRDFCTIIDQPNRGVSEARNAALDIAKGDYVYMLDGDDSLTDNAIDEMLSIISTLQPDIILSPTHIIKKNNNFIRKLEINEGVYTPDYIFQNLSIFPIMPQLLYRRALIEEHEIRFNKKLTVGEVYDFTLHFLRFSDKIAVCDNIFFNYIAREQSATRKLNPVKDLTILTTIESYENNGYPFIKYDSFYITNFSMVMAFTYNKYAKAQQTNRETYSLIRQILLDKLVRKSIYKTSFSRKSTLKIKIRALFILLTGLNGYKFIAHLKKFSR